MSPASRACRSRASPGKTWLRTMPSASGGQVDELAIDKSVPQQSLLERHPDEVFLDAVRPIQVPLVMQVVAGTARRDFGDQLRCTVEVTIVVDSTAAARFGKNQECRHPPAHRSRAPARSSCCRRRRFRACRPRSSPARSPDEREDFHVVENGQQPACRQLPECVPPSSGEASPPDVGETPAARVGPRSRGAALPDQPNATTGAADRTHRGRRRRRSALRDSGRASPAAGDGIPRA